MSNLEPYHQVTSDTTQTNQSNPTTTTGNNNSMWTAGYQDHSAPPPDQIQHETQQQHHDPSFNVAKHQIASEEEPFRNRSGSLTFSSSATDPNAHSSFAGSAGGETGGRRTSIADVNPDSTHPAANVSEPINPASESSPLNPHHRPSIQGDHHQGLTGEEHMETRGSISQNAPGKLGERGEKLIGAMGFGGSTVERPREEQGLGEKIANFLGA